MDEFSELVNSMRKYSNIVDQYESKMGDRVADNMNRILGYRSYMGVIGILIDK